MTRMDQPEVNMMNIEPHDRYRSRSPRRDRSSGRRADDELLPEFQQLSIREKKDKDGNRRKSLSIEAGKFTRRRSSSGGRQHPQNFELYRFEKCGNDWTVADRIRISAPQNELKQKVVKRKSKIPIVDMMTGMHHLRRRQIDRLLKQKNDGERDRDVEWVPVLVEKKRWSGKSIFTMDVIIAKTFNPGGYERRSSFEGERSDLRVPLRSKSRDKDKGKDKDKDKDKDKFNEIKWNDRERDFFAEEQLFTRDGRPAGDQGRPFDGHRDDRRPIPLEDPIAGLPPLRPPPVGWADPPPQVPFPLDDHNNQPPIEVINDGQHDDGILNLDQILDKPSGGGGGGGGHANQNFEDPHPIRFPGAGEDNFTPIDGARRRSSEGRKRSGSRPRSTKTYTYRGHSRRGYRGADHYGDSSIDDPDEEMSMFFYSDDRSSASSFSTDHERQFEWRGSLKRRPSDRRGEPIYREHRRRPMSYNHGRNEMILETARTPRRRGIERRQTIAYPVSPRQITYPYDSGRRRDWNDEPMSPVLTHQSDSPGFSRRRESRGPPPPEVFFPDEIDGKGRAPDDYQDPIGREPRYREDEVRRHERDTAKGRRGSRGAYRDQREGWDWR
jgi:hypothetical protein